MAKTYRFHNIFVDLGDFRAAKSRKTLSVHSEDRVWLPPIFRDQLGPSISKERVL
jgi:hypothetical protein